MRFAVFAAALLLTAPALAAPQCGGKYDAAAAMADAAIGKYGTLYSGGDHWHRLDHIGATLDLLRLWRDRPDAGFRKAELPWDVDIPYDGPTFSPDEVSAALDVVDHDVADEPPPMDPARTALVLDFATSPGPRVGWWREQPPDGTAKRALPALAEVRPTLDWLQVIAAQSDARWAMAWHLPDWRDGRAEDFDGLMADSLAKYHAGQGIEWAVAAQLLWQPGTVAEEELRLMEGEWEERVRTCEATPAEYAAFAIAMSNSARFVGLTADPQRMALLPDQIALRVARNAAMGLVMATPQDLGARLAALDGLSDDPLWHSWLGVARTYAATTVAQVADIHRGRSVNAKSLRALNVLSAADLRRLALSGAFGDAVEMRLLRAAFARQVALGQSKDAAALLSLLRGRLANGEVPALEHRLPFKVAVALAAARLPDLTTVIGGDEGGYAYEGDYGLHLYESRFRREMPAEYDGGAALQGDLETWLMLPQAWYRYFGMHGATWAALDRHHARANYGEPAAPAPHLFGAVSGASFGIAGLADFQELAQLRAVGGVTRQVSLTLLAWAEDVTSNPFRRWLAHPDLTAEVLYRVVMLNRHVDGGDLDGVPMGKRAFRLLHRYYPYSEWAGKARYWWKGRT